MADMLTNWVNDNPLLVVIALCVVMVGILVGALAILAMTIDTE